MSVYLHTTNSLFADGCVSVQVVQRKWVYLEPIFGRGALPAEQGRFNTINADFLDVMRHVKSDDRVVSLVKRTGIKSALETMEDQLSRCQKALSAFLEEKRAAFPRFYFIGTTLSNRRSCL